MCIKYSDNTSIAVSYDRFYLFTIANNSSHDEIQITAQSVEDVDKDNSTAQNNESAVQSDDKDSVKTVKKNTSNSSTSSKKDTTKNTNSTNTTSKNETSKPTSSNKPTASSKPSTPQHTHSWTAVYKEVDKGYYDTVTKKVAYTKCHLCGADITGKVVSHMEAHGKNGEVGSYGTAYHYYEEKVWVL